MPIVHHHISHSVLAFFLRSYTVYLYSPSGRCSGQSGAVEFLLESWSAAVGLA